MNFLSWIKSSDRKPTAADLPVEVYWGTTLRKSCALIEIEHADGTLRRDLDNHISYTHWRPYRPLTPDQLTVEPANDLVGPGAASVKAFLMVRRLISLRGAPLLAERAETVARELEAYAAEKANDAVENFKAVAHFSKDAEISRQKGEIDGLEMRVELRDREIAQLKLTANEDRIKRGITHNEHALQVRSLRSEINRLTARSVELDDLEQEYNARISEGVSARCATKDTQIRRLEAELDALRRHVVEQHALQCRPILVHENPFLTEARDRAQRRVKELEQTLQTMNHGINRVLNS